MVTKICKMCGEEFTGESNRAIYCPRCRTTRRKETQEAYRRTKGMRAIGDEAKCSKCGKPFILTKSRQKYCEECAKLVLSDTIARTTSAAIKERKKRELEMNIPQSGIPGITWSRWTAHWQLVINSRYYGLYDSVEKADEARRFFTDMLTSNGGTVDRQLTVREMRKILGLTQAEFGDKYHIPKNTIANWESGITTPPLYVLELLQRAVMEDRNPGDF